MERTFVDRARRTQLVDCAIEAIAELGLPRASLAEIARRAKLTKATVLYHFSGRDELINEVLGTVLARGAEFMAERMDESAGPAARLDAYIESNVEYIAKYRDEVRVLVAIAMNFTDENGNSKLRHDASVYGDSLAPLREILHQGQVCAEFGDFNTRVMAMSIRAAIDAIGPQLSVIPDLDVDEYSRDLAALFKRATQRLPKRG